LDCGQVELAARILLTVSDDHHDDSFGTAGFVELVEAALEVADPLAYGVQQGSAGPGDEGCLSQIRDRLYVSELMDHFIRVL